MWSMRIPALLFLLFSLTAVRAQLALPEYAPEEPDSSDTASGPDPARRGHAKSEKSTDGAGTEPLEESELSAETLRQLAPSRMRLEPGEAEKEVLEGARRLEDLYLGGPERVRVQVATDRGGVRAETENRTFRVRGAVGVFPVRLHEVRRMEKVGNGGGYRLELVGGDVLEGVPDFQALDLLRADGGRRVVPLEAVEALSVQDPEF